MKRTPVPCGDRILVKLKPLEKTGVIELIDKYAERDLQATCLAYVIFAGYDAWKTLGSGKPWAKPGHLVSIKKYAGEDDKTVEEGCIYRVLSDDDIVCWWPGEDLEESELNEILQQYTNKLDCNDIEALKREFMHYE